MILQALYEYYQRKDNVPPLGYEYKEIPFLIVLNKNGEFAGLEDTRHGEKKRGKTYLVHKTKGRSGSKASSVTNVLWDHYGFVLTHPKDSTDKAKADAIKQHETFVSKVKEISDKFPNNESFKTVLRFLSNEEEKKKAFEHPYWADCAKKPGCNMSFLISGETKIIAEDDDLKSLVNIEDVEVGNTTKEQVCLITGEKGKIAELHTSTSINEVGGKSGGKLVSFQKHQGYDSYNKQQGGNAPISVEAESAYTTALNTLIKSPKNKVRVGDTLALFWASRDNELEEKLPFVFAPPTPPKDDPDKNVREVKSLLESHYTGKLYMNGDTDFYLLGLVTPNPARISVRFWKKGTVREFAENIVQHFKDLEIVLSKNDKEYLTIFKILTHISLEFKSENAPPNISGALVQSVINGALYPATLQQQCIRRIKAEQHVNRVRAAILKAYLNRKDRIYNTNQNQLTMALDKENKNQGYLCGRLFAVLEKIQQEAQPGLNATIKDRFYGAASSTPVTVFGRLLNLSNHHLVKLNPGRKTNLEKLLQEIMADISADGLPSHLTLDDQSRFAVGYYHQRQDFYTKHEKETKSIN